MQKQIDEPIYKKLEKIETDIQDLKLLMLQHLLVEKVVSIGGMLKGVKINDMEIKEAKSSLFKSRI
jgi:hypothetical protein